MKAMTRILLLFVVFGAISCGSGPEKSSHQFDNPNLREVVVKEIQQTSSYTYLKLKEEGDVYWAAIPRQDDIVLGKTYYFDNWMEMKDFPSKELDKTFASIYFLQYISDQPFSSQKKAAAKPKGSSRVGNMEITSVEPAEGGITIAELYADKKEYAGKKVIVKGVVVKYTQGVMKRNWVHIQDGTQYADDFDLTITTTDQLENGDVATFEGTVTLNKDFGHGYAYELIMEDAVLIAKEKDSVLQ